MLAKFNQRFNLYKAIRIQQEQYTGEEILNHLGIHPGQPVIVFMGGAAEMDSEDATRLKRVIAGGVARAAAEIQATVVDGGTDSGTLGLLNEALGERQHKGLYIGVAPDSLTHLPDHPSNGHLVALGGVHTHFVLVEGDQWGDELGTMYAIVNALAENTPSIGILINGGSGAQNEVGENIADERKVMVLEGSGRLADAISLQLHNPWKNGTPEVQKLSQTGDFSVFDTNADPEELATKIKSFLKSI